MTCTFEEKLSFEYVLTCKSPLGTLNEGLPKELEVGCVLLNISATSLVAKCFLGTKKQRDPNSKRSPVNELLSALVKRPREEPQCSGCIVGIPASSPSAGSAALWWCCWDLYRTTALYCTSYTYIILYMYELYDTILPCSFISPCAICVYIKYIETYPIHTIQHAYGHQSLETFCVHQLEASARPELDLVDSERPVHRSPGLHRTFL